jgi:hypothetical protein
MSYNNDREQGNWGNNNQGGQQRGRRVEAAPGAKLFGKFLFLTTSRKPLLAH